MTVTKPAVSLGAIYAVPGGGHYAFAKVVYLSEYFKDVLLVRLYERGFTAPMDIPSSFKEIPSRGIFTGLDSVQKGSWVFVRLDVVAAEDIALTRRIVGGDVWIEDEHIGPASDADKAALPNMDIYGYRLIEKAVARLS